MTDAAGSAQALTPPLYNLSHMALFLDIDGTLLEIEPRPENVTADAYLRALLRALEERTGGALAILTGRALSDADRVLAHSVRCVAALHGQDCRLGEEISKPRAPDDAWRRARQVVARFVEAGALGAEMEDKGGAVALHYRDRPELEPLIVRAVDEIAESHGLRALHGKMVSELMPRGATKGVALAALMRTAPFEGRKPIAIGDDVTDEDAFVAANELGGISILVGERQGSAALYALRDVTAVRAWLEANL